MPQSYKHMQNSHHECSLKRLPNWADTAHCCDCVLCTNVRRLIDFHSRLFFGSLLCEFALSEVSCCRSCCCSNTHYLPQSCSSTAVNLALVGYSTDIHSGVNVVAVQCKIWMNCSKFNGIISVKKEVLGFDLKVFYSICVVVHLKTFKLFSFDAGDSINRLDQNDQDRSEQQVRNVFWEQPLKVNVKSTQEASLQIWELDWSCLTDFCGETCWDTITVAKPTEDKSLDKFF